jgi:hypothetical protein
MNKTWTLEIGADGVLPLPDDFLMAAGLEVDDEIEWIDQGDGTWMIRRVETAVPPRSRIEPRDVESGPVTLSLTAEQIRDLYVQTQNLADDTEIDFYVDRSNGIGPVVRARWSAEMDLTDVARW